MAVRVDRAPIGQAGDSTAFETCRPAHFPSSMSGVLGVAGFDADSTSACISVARSAPPFAPIFRSIVLRTGKAVETRDRKSVVEGKSVSVRVDLGGRRIIKKKSTMNKYIPFNPHMMIVHLIFSVILHTI